VQRSTWLTAIRLRHKLQSICLTVDLMVRRAAQYLVNGYPVAVQIAEYLFND
jgi:hypothetical protein